MRNHQSEGKANRLACLPTKAVLIDWSCLWLFLGPMEELDVFVLGTPYPLSITYTFPPQGNGTRLYASKELELEVVGVIALHDTEHHFLKSSVSGNNCTNGYVYSTLINDDEDEDEDEEEEYPAPADSVPPVHRMTARISIRDEPFISLPPREEVKRLLALTTPPPSPLTPLS
ncbi:hypothetical protein Tco_0466346, partial [Tanacetum coccineum]